MHGAAVQWAGAGAASVAIAAALVAVGRWQGRVTAVLEQLTAIVTRLDERFREHEMSRRH